MRREYQVVGRKGSAALRQFLAREGAALVPMMELLEAGQLAVEELVGEMGKAALEAVLLISAEEVAGPAHPGRPGGVIRRHGEQGGIVALGGQKVRVSKPRLRRKGGGEGAEVAVPAYAAMQSDERLRERMLSIVMRGVSTRHYQEVVPELAERCGVSRSAVSRQLQEASAEALRELCERRFDDLDLLVIYLDGKHFGGHQVVSAIGVDAAGCKHVLGLTEGATENAVVVKGLLEELVERGVRPERRRLLVIDGSKALRKAIDDVFGKQHPVQRCLSRWRSLSTKRRIPAGPVTALLALREIVAQRYPMLGATREAKSVLRDVGTALVLLPVFCPHIRSTRLPEQERLTPNTGR